MEWVFIVLCLDHILDTYLWIYLKNASYILTGPSWLWSYDSWIYNYLYNQRLSPLMLLVRTPFMVGVLDTTLCDKVRQWLAVGLWFSPDTPVSSTNKSDCHDIAAVLLKMALNNIINQQTYILTNFSYPNLIKFDMFYAFYKCSLVRRHHYPNTIFYIIYVTPFLIGRCQINIFRYHLHDWCRQKVCALEA